MVNLLKTGAILTGVLAIFVGLILSPIPRSLGFYRALTSHHVRLIGISPAFHSGIKWNYNFDDLYRDDLPGESALVTGANSGIGYEIALALARLNVSVTLACRSPVKCQEAAEKIQSDSRNKKSVSTMTVDMSSLTSVKNSAQKYLETHQDSSLDMLFLNAGIGTAGKNEDGSFPLSEDGIDKVFATNYVGHHLLYKYLEPLMKKSKFGRIVLTSSLASFDTFEYKVATDLQTLNNQTNWEKKYGQSKLAQIMWAKELTRRLGPNSTVYVNAANPGTVDTGIWDKNPLIPQKVQRVINYFRKNVMWTSEEGALTMLYLGVAKNSIKDNDIRGKYYHPQSQEVVNHLALDEDLQQKLWKFSDELVQKFM